MGWPRRQALHCSHMPSHFRLFIDNPNKGQMHLHYKNVDSGPDALDSLDIDGHGFRTYTWKRTWECP